MSSLSAPHLPAALPVPGSMLFEQLIDLLLTYNNLLIKSKLKT